MVRLLPKETKFFDMFEEMSSNLILGATAITDLLRDFQDTAGYVKKIKDIEHRGDEITHTVFVKLNSTFITPFDREDIHTLASSLDDVLDFINAAADRIILYKITPAPPAAYEIAQIIVKQSRGPRPRRPQPRKTERRAPALRRSQSSGERSRSHQPRSHRHDSSTPKKIPSP